MPCKDTPKKIISKSPIWSPLSGSLVNKRNNPAKTDITATKAGNSTNKTIQKLDVNALQKKLQKRQNLYAQRELAGTLAKSRVSVCGKYAIKGLNAQIWSTTSKSASYKNLIYCTSVWDCPCCSKKIRSRRGLETMEISKGLQKDGYHLIFLTLTKKHGKNRSAEAVKETLKKVNKDWSAMMAERRIKDINKEFSLEYFKALEITTSQKNGFHPHLHVVLAFKCDDSLINFVFDTLTDLYQSEWIKRNQGTQQMFQDSKLVYNVEIEERMTDYITRLDLINEVTNPSQAKRGRAFGHYNPLGIPEMILTNDLQGNTVEQLENTFKVYSWAIKGSRFMTYSRGLKKKYIQIKTDEEICSDVSTLDKEICEISPKVWGIVVERGLRARLINVIEVYLNDPNLFLSDLLKQFFKKNALPIELDHYNILNYEYKL